MHISSSLRLYLCALVASAATLSAHLIGSHYGLYAYFAYPAFLKYIGGGYDIFMHMLGGATIGIFVAALLVSLGFKTRAWRIIVAVMFVGLSWEVFEAVNGIAGAPFGEPLYFRDTIKDLIDDFIGGSVVAWAVNKHYFNERSSN